MSERDEEKQSVFALCESICHAFYNLASKVYLAKRKLQKGLRCCSLHELHCPWPRKPIPTLVPPAVCHGNLLEWTSYPSIANRQEKNPVNINKYKYT